MGAIVLVYYMDKRGLINRIMEIQHSFENVISSTMHVHLTKDKCLEIIGVRGNASDAKALAQRLMAVKGVKQLKFATMIP
jgi:CopG family nickel-responsive transcriptional regulator